MPLLCVVLDSYILTDLTPRFLLGGIRTCLVRTAALTLTLSSSSTFVLLCFLHRVTDPEVLPCPDGFALEIVALEHHQLCCFAWMHVRPWDGRGTMRVRDPHVPEVWHSCVHALSGEINPYPSWVDYLRWDKGCGCGWKVSECHVCCPTRR